MIYSPEVEVSNEVLVDGSAHIQPVSGSVTVSGTVDTSGSSVAVSNFPATQPVSGTVSISGTVSTITAVASTATLTIVSLPASTDTLILAANGVRKSAILFVPKSGTSIKYGSGSSATSFTFVTGAANSTITVTGYTGLIHAFGPAQSINVTELA